MPSSLAAVATPRSRDLSIVGAYVHEGQRKMAVTSLIRSRVLDSLPSGGGDLGEEIEVGTCNGYLDVEHLGDDLCPAVKEVDPAIDPRDHPRCSGASLVEKN